MEKKPNKVDKWCQKHNCPKFYTPWGQWECLGCIKEQGHGKNPKILKAQAICGKELPSRLK